MVTIATPVVAPDLRVPPQSVETEQSVLGGLLQSNSAFDRIVDVVHEADFYREEHRLIFRAVIRLIEAGKPADALTVAEFLKEHGKLDSVGGQHYIGSLVINTPSAANIRRYAEIVRDRALLRGLVERAQELIEACATPGGADPHQIAEAAESGISKLMDRQRGDCVALGDAVAQAIQHIDELHAKGGGMAGLSTGFVDLDRMTGGFSGGDLIILAGRTSMGKTALGMNIATHVARHHGAVAVFSLEMAQQQLATRVLSGCAAISMHRLRTGHVSDDQWPAIAEAGTKLREIPILLDDTPGVSCAHVRARCRRIKRQHGLTMVVVDYLQLMRGEGDNRTQEVGSISRGLKNIAKELNIPVIALSQLSRKVEERTDKRPQLSDLRDSGELEQDADLIAFLYRDEVYRKDSPAKGTAELLIKKQRNGPLGDIRLWFREELMRFESYGGPEIESTSRPRTRAPAGFDYKSAQAGEKQEAA